MTELPDTAEIRERWAAWSPAPMAPGGTILALCDALDAAREVALLVQGAADLRLAELGAAESELAELEAAMRDDRDNWCDCAVHWRGARDRCKARIAAVRAVLDAHGPDGMNSAGYDLWSDVNHALLP